MDRANCVGAYKVVLVNGSHLIVVLNEIDQEMMIVKDCAKQTPTDLAATSVATRMAVLPFLNSFSTHSLEWKYFIIFPGVEIFLNI